MQPSLFQTNKHRTKAHNKNKNRSTPPAQKVSRKKERLLCSVRTEWIGIASCFVRVHPSSTKMEETFHPMYALCFARACDGWRAWRHTPAVLIHHLIITKGSADRDDLLYLLARSCQTPSFSKDNSVTSSLPLQNKPTTVKDCRMSIKKIQIHSYWHQAGGCTPSYSGMRITLYFLNGCSMVT